MNKVYRELTIEELDALRTYAKKHGRNWKSSLREAWMTASELGYLQALRNSHGPHWLNTFKLPEVMGRSGADVVLEAFPAAASMWQGKMKLVNGVHTLELFVIGTSTVVVHDYPNFEGWDAYVPVTTSGRVDETLDAIACHCGEDRRKS